MDVIPIWTVERNWVGLSSKRRAAIAPASPVSAITCNLALRLAAKAISDMAKIPLITTRKISSAKSIGGADQSRARNHDPRSVAESVP